MKTQIIYITQLKREITFYIGQPKQETYQQDNSFQKIQPPQVDQRPDLMDDNLPTEEAPF